MGPRLVGREDEDVPSAIREIVEHEGVEVRTNAKCLGGARRVGGKIVASVDCAAGAPAVRGTHLLLGTEAIVGAAILGTGGDDVIAIASRGSTRDPGDKDWFCPVPVHDVSSRYDPTRAHWDSGLPHSPRVRKAAVLGAWKARPR